MTTTTAEATDRRASRYEARHLLWNITGLNRVRACGRTTREAGGAFIKVSIADDGTRSAGWGNVTTCGSVWACPNCSVKIALGRQEEITRAADEWHARGGRIGFVTLTMRHHKGQSLKTLWDALSTAWHDTTSRAAWADDQATAGVMWERVIRSGKRAGEVEVKPRVPLIRTVEVTHGQSGWHVHVHALVLIAGTHEQRLYSHEQLQGLGITDRTVLPVREVHANLAGLAHGMFGRWRDSLTRQGLAAPLRSRGLDFRLLEGEPGAAMADYFTKAVYRSVNELTRSDTKTAKNGNRTPFAILAGLVETHRTGDLGEWGTPEDQDIWAEWERVSKGRRQIQWSAGLRAALLGDEPELTDEQLAEKAELEGQIVAEVSSGAYREIVRDRADLLVLRAFERSFAEGHELLRGYEARAAAALAGFINDRRGVRLDRPPPL